MMSSHKRYEVWGHEQGNTIMIGIYDNITDAAKAYLDHAGIEGFEVDLYEVDLGANAGGDRE